ncbi:hypothetical protein OROMI_024174 [Orobanche minor]
MDIMWGCLIMVYNIIIHLISSESEDYWNDGEGP